MTQEQRELLINDMDRMSKMYNYYLYKRFTDNGGNTDIVENKEM